MSKTIIFIFKENNEENIKTKKSENTTLDIEVEHILLDKKK